MILKPLGLAAMIGALAFAHDVRADDDDYAPSAGYYEEQPGPYSYSWNEPYLPSQIGVGLILGGGITGFTDRAMRDSTSSVGGLWDARLSIGTHVPIGLDVSYVGTAASIDALSGQGSASLLGTTVEGALRWNILPHFPVDPYVFAGIGWQHYSLTDVTTPLVSSNLKATDNFVEFPMGVGISFRDTSGFLFDLRGTFRAAGNSTMVFDPRSGNFADMHTWEASAALGYEF